MSPSRAPSRGAAPGFTLIELLVAMAIAAMVIAAAVSSVSGSLSAGARSRGYVEAALIARSQLALAEIEAVEGESSGEQRLAGELFRWQLTLAPHELHPEQDPRPAAPLLLAATVQVTWGDETPPRSLTATTLLVAPPTSGR